MNRSRVLAAALAFIFAALPSFAQYPQTLTVASTSPAIVTSAPTKPGVRYTITVTGTYSMWPTYDSYGVDAANVYDVPQAEVAAFRWPPAFIYPIPHWVGDTVQVPPFNIPGLQFRFNSRENIGFRVNGVPLANVGVNPLHRYYTTVIGDGGPISFQILDSAFSISQGRIIPRYEDNSGALRVLIEEQPYMNVCDVATVCRDNRPGSLTVSASFLRYDRNDSTTRPRNILSDPSQISLVTDAGIIRPDSVVCGRSVKEGTAYTLVFDRSYSMDEQWGATTRLGALKSAATNFLKTTGPADSMLLISFAGTWKLEQNWTGDTARMGAKIRGIQTSAATAYRDAAFEGVKRAAGHYLPYKAVILLTDGEDNSSTVTAEQVIARARQMRVPIFVIGVSLNGTARAELRRIADSTGGKYFTADDQRMMDSVFANIGREIQTDRCCTIYFTPPASFFSHVGPRAFDVIASDGNGGTFMQTLEVYIPASCGGTQTSGIDEVETGAGELASAALSVSPNPASSGTVVRLDLPRAADVMLDVIAPDGAVAARLIEGAREAGHHEMPIDARAFPPGIYFIRARLDERTLLMEKLVIQR